MIDNTTWEAFQKRLDYNEDHMDIFKKNPRNNRLINNMMNFNKNHSIIIEVIKSHGCNGGHKAGDILSVFDGSGNQITKYSPKTICIYALSRTYYKIYTVLEMISKGIAPSEIEMAFPNFSCPDVGIENGGWGQIIMGIRVVSRDQLSKLINKQ